MVSGSGRVNRRPPEHKASDDPKEKTMRSLTRTNMIK